MTNLRWCHCFAAIWVLAVSASCVSPKPPECVPDQPPISTFAVQGSWEISLLAGDGSTLDVSSMLFVRIAKTPDNADAGTFETCRSPSEAQLTVTFLSGDNQFKNAAMSGTFAPSASQAGAGILSLQLGALSVEATVGADATVDSSSGSWRDDAGSRGMSVVLMRTSL